MAAHRAQFICLLCVFPLCFSSSAPAETVHVARSVRSMWIRIRELYVFQCLQLYCCLWLFPSLASPFLSNAHRTLLNETHVSETDVYLIRCSDRSFSATLVYGELFIFPTISVKALSSYCNVGNMWQIDCSLFGCFFAFDSGKQ